MKKDKPQSAYMRRVEIFNIAKRELEQGRNYVITTQASNMLNPHDHSIMENMPAFINGMKISYRAVGSSSEWTFQRDLSEWNIKGATFNVHSYKGNVNLAIIQINDIERSLPMLDETPYDTALRIKIIKLRTHLTNTLKEI